MYDFPPHIWLSLLPTFLVTLESSIYFLTSDYSLLASFSAIILIHVISYYCGLLPGLFAPCLFHLFGTICCLFNTYSEVMYLKVLKWFVFNNFNLSLHTSLMHRSGSWVNRGRFHLHGLSLQSQPGSYPDLTTCWTTCCLHWTLQTLHLLVTPVTVYRAVLSPVHHWGDMDALHPAPSTQVVK